LNKIFNYFHPATDKTRIFIEIQSITVNMHAGTNDAFTPAPVTKPGIRFTEEKEKIMKKLITFAAMSLLTTPAFAAGAWPESSDTYGNILNDERPAFVGTGLSEQARQENIYGSLVGPDNQDGFKVGNAGPEKGNNDSYGSVLHDAGNPM